MKREPIGFCRADLFSTVGNQSQIFWRRDTAMLKCLPLPPFVFSLSICQRISPKPKQIWRHPKEHTPNPENCGLFGQKNSAVLAVPYSSEDKPDTAKAVVRCKALKKCLLRHKSSSSVSINFDSPQMCRTPCKCNIVPKQIVMWNSADWCLCEETVAKPSKPLRVERENLIHSISVHSDNSNILMGIKAILFNARRNN